MQNTQCLLLRTTTATGWAGHTELVSVAPMGQDGTDPEGWL